VRQRRPPRLIIREVRLKLSMDCVVLGVFWRGKRVEDERGVTSRPRREERVCKAVVRFELAG
jgi:hypothetical protein